ncbi:hypothetical protein GE107_20675 [Cohnella sp. CFH 77786]|uniref:hypothetical protein n=1 Tax=Cohnella sp. CFH 77786 TaxID=2662265 RepID=UPI001C608C0B|nr:hypothetical protein [Cohnella sp. CFH 77786]MBW5448463.1 hypothetical protein [Cohnella sp. CFH 77786]
MVIQNNHYRFERFLRRFQLYLNENKIDTALEWAWLTGASGWHCHPGFFTSIELESSLVSIGANIHKRKNAFQWNLKHKNTDGVHWLHVLTSAYKTGGHTRLAERWMLHCKEDERHSIVLIDQEANHLPDWLIHAARGTGGDYIEFPSKMSKFEKAIALKEISDNWADIVVLHAHPDDPVPSVAYGESGGPPVICCNHAAQNFWIGSSITDLVIDGRLPEYTDSLYRRHIRNAAMIPMPLQAKTVPNKLECKRRLGLPELSTVMLTIGDPYKFTPYKHYHFPNVLADVLNRYSNTYLIAVGPDVNDVLWREAITSSNGKMILVGRQNDLTDYYGSADLYLESFPFGSFTASLDACLYGIPIVLGPKPLNPILSLNRYDGMEDHPETIIQYIEILEKFIINPVLRQERGEIQKRHVSEQHVGLDWRSKMDEAILLLPQRHEVGLMVRESPSACEDFDSAWAELQAEQNYGMHLMHKMHSFLRR